MNIDPILKLAMAMHTSPGVYALLLGSGVSRAASIPTGWEIVLDLIAKVAAMVNEAPQGDLAAWYRQRFGEDADYARLLDRLTTTPSERMALLRSYFEPSQEEREQGLKVPTAAHKAIANLVKLGCVRMILTTNFDRLTENALQTVGIVRDVIASDDAMKGAMPYIHSPCVVVKLHGDYRDIRIRNTPEELAKYSRRMSKFLDRVFEEFGVIVCGWSGEWDTALRDALLRSPTRRFTAYWLAKGELTEEANHIIQHRRAEVIPVEDADNLFVRLLEAVESLRELESPCPVSTAVAVATVKRYVSDGRNRIRLHDLIDKEAAAIREALQSDRFSWQTWQLTKELFQGCIHRCEALCDRLMAMLAALSYHDAGENAHILTRCIQKLTPTKARQNRFGGDPEIQFYPALLLSYAAGISAVGGSRFCNLAAILRAPTYRDTVAQVTSPAIQKLNTWSVFYGRHTWVPRPNAEREFTPVSNHLLDLLRPMLLEYFADAAAYDESFDIFEYLLALTYIDIVDPSRAPVGRFGWKYRFRWEQSSLGDFIRTGLERGAVWELLRAGFFSASEERVRDVKATLHRLLPELTKGWF